MRFRAHERVSPSGETGGHRSIWRRRPPHHQLHNSLNGGSDGHGGIEDDVLPPALVPVPEALIDPTVVPVVAPLLDAETLLPP
jgi:hypothetical protein